MKITIIDNVWACVGKADIPVIRPALSYDSSFFRQGPFKKVREASKKSLVDRVGRFPAGLVERVRSYCIDRDIPVEVEGERPILPFSHPHLPTFTLREDQRSLIDTALAEQRGVLVSPTGSGKTVIAMHLLEAFKGRNILFLVQAKGLLSQSKQEFSDNGFQDVGIIGDGVMEPDQITIAMVQTLSKMGPTEFLKAIDVVIVDECHHAGAETYQDILSWCPAPVRLGLTASPPPDLERTLKIEGMLGPIIHAVTIDDLKVSGILAKPLIRILRPPDNQALADMRVYKDVYEKGIVMNRHRNKMALDLCAEFVDDGLVALALVMKIEHGNELIRMAEILYPDMKIVFVQGKTDTEVREQIKQAMESGETQCVIATAVFREGINIKNVHLLINLCGGKSELQLIQGIGRGLRTTATKKMVTIADFCDAGNRYLAQHSLERLWVYIDMGWMQ